MRLLTRLLARTLSSPALSSPSQSSHRRHAVLVSRSLHSQPFIRRPESARLGVLASPWSTSQLRRFRIRGADVRPGNVIQRKGKTYQVVKSQHTTQGRGGAAIQVELRDTESGNKVNERLRTDETVEKVYVEQKSMSYLYVDDDTDCVVLMDPKTHVKLDVPKQFFGENIVYLQDDMTVTVELFDERPMSASVPLRVTCTVTDAQVHMKGLGATPHNKKVSLDNGLTVQVPAFIVAGDKILVNTSDNSYISR
ncbi:hypothetical protein RJ640_012651 [Escallonia rubra]|uniref:Elongation factor P n=1 Tax=Escallonia rubra TaxID=112253 RepID=A0AA88QRR1_9ASTE|nr:hypothetical protein RJ640_012651 [Escallonia rubra]